MATGSSSEDHGGDELGSAHLQTRDARETNEQRQRLGSQRRALAIARACARLSLACPGRGVHGSLPATRDTAEILLSTRGRSYRAPTATSWVHEAHPGVADDEAEARKHGEAEDVVGEGRGPRRSSTARVTWTPPSELLRSKMETRRGQEPAHERTDEGDKRRRRNALTGAAAEENHGGGGGDAGRGEE